MPSPRTLRAWTWNQPLADSSCHTTGARHQVQPAVSGQPLQGARTHGPPEDRPQPLRCEGLWRLWFPRALRGPDRTLETREPHQRTGGLPTSSSSLWAAWGCLCLPHDTGWADPPQGPMDTGWAGPPQSPVDTGWTGPPQAPVDMVLWDTEPAPRSTILGLLFCTDWFAEARAGPD